MKKFLFILLIGVLSLTFILKDRKVVTGEADLNVEAEAIVVIEADSGKILYEENSKEALPIASMSKLMTQYIVLNTIKNGSLSWENTYEPSDYVLQTTGQSAFVKLGMTKGNAYTVTELFTAMTVNSANDAAIALAEMVSGSEEDFVQLMNKQAKKLGLKKTTFFNASGLDGNYIGKGEDETNRSSARDVSILSQKLIATHPEIIELSRTSSFTSNEGTTFWSTNLMLPGMPQAFTGIDGLKTGFTDQAGPCFASTGVFNGKRIITVVMNVQADGADTINPKFELTRELIEQFVLN